MLNKYTEVVYLFCAHKNVIEYITKIKDQSFKNALWWSDFKGM